MYIFVSRLDPSCNTHKSDHTQTHTHTRIAVTLEEIDEDLSDNNLLLIQRKDGGREGGQFEESVQCNGLHPTTWPDFTESRRGEADSEREAASDISRSDQT